MPGLKLLARLPPFRPLWQPLLKIYENVLFPVLSFLMSAQLLMFFLCIYTFLFAYFYSPPNSCFHIDTEAHLLLVTAGVALSNEVPKTSTANLLHSYPDVATGRDGFHGPSSKLQTRHAACHITLG